VNSVRRGRSSAEGASGVSGFRTLALAPKAATSLFREHEPSSTTARRPSAAPDSERQNGALRAQLEIARAELAHQEQELAALRSQLAFAREENELLRHSLRSGPLSGAVSIAPRVGGAGDDFEVVALPEPVLEYTLSEPSASPAPKPDFDPNSEAAYPILRNLILSAGNAAAGHDRRGERRHDCEIEVEFADESHFFAGLTQDISRGGLFVSTYHLLPVGSRLNLRFELPNGVQIEVLGRVRWVLDSEADSESESRPGIGIEFVDPSPEILRSIAAFCEPRPPLYFDTMAPPGAC